MTCAAGVAFLPCAAFLFATVAVTVTATTAEGGRGGGASFSSSSPFDTKLSFGVRVCDLCVFYVVFLVCVSFFVREGEMKLMEKLM